MRTAAASGGLLAATLLLGACSMSGLAGLKASTPERVAAAPAAVATAAAFEPLAFAATPPRALSMNGMVGKYAALYDVPEALIHRVIMRESGYNPTARNGPYMGLMQIHPATARSMGYRGDAEGLLDADTNLRYAVKYLRGAYIVGGRNADNAVRHYSRGYYYEAKRQGLLDEVGL